MSRRRWLVPLVTLGAALLYLRARRGARERLATNLHAFGMPSAALYDLVVGALFGGFYARVAGETTALCPTGLALDVGSGPGDLAVRLARMAPDLRITGLDISPDMVARATSRAARSGLADRVRFVVGDAAALPFPDGQFDVVVSTVSLHHWPDPVRGLAEIHRVLKPGGKAYIYDLADRLLRAMRHGKGVEQAAAASAFDGYVIETLRWPGPVPAISRLHLSKGGV